GLDEHGWHPGNAGGRGRPVGQKKGNPWGLFGLLGNVAERGRGLKGGALAGTDAAPAGPRQGQRAAGKGGSVPGHAGGVSPGTAANHIGFRVALEVPEPPAPSPRFASLVDADVKGFESWINKMKADGLRPAYAHAHTIAGKVRFAAIAIRDSRPFSWEA